MPLILTITPASAGAPARGERQIRTLAQGTLSIGRAPGNDWVLADPDQHLSRTHCMVAFEGGRYVMTDLSTNGMLVNGAREPTARNSRLVLTDGDSIRLGGYILDVAEADGAAGGLQSSPFGAQGFLNAPGSGNGQGLGSGQGDPFAGGGSDGPLDADPLDDPIGHSASLGFHHPLPHPPPSLRVEDPFDAAEAEARRPASLDDDLFRPREAPDAFKGPAQHDRGDVRSHAYTAPRPLVPARVADIDFDDLIGDLSPTPAPHPLDPPAAASPTSPVSRGPVPSGPVSPSLVSPGLVSPGLANFDDLLGDLEPVAPAAVPAPLAATPPVAPIPVAPMPVAAIPAEVSSAALAPAAASTSVAAEPAVAIAPAAMPAPGVVPGVAPGSEQAALLAAFLEGAGVPRLDMGAEDPVAAMRAMGVLFAAFVAGTREVLMSRAEIKSELRVERTMLRARDNNALKFSVSPEEAVAALLRPRAGYTAPLAAVEEAFRDVRSHEMAVMAGLQTALIALLKRFDPAGLEARLQGGGMFDAILPGARRARFWELFCTTYNDIAREAQDDFHSVFGREFARAYAAQLGKL